MDSVREEVRREEDMSKNKKNKALNAIIVVSIIVIVLLVCIAGALYYIGTITHWSPVMWILIGIAVALTIIKALISTGKLTGKNIKSDERDR